MDSINLFLIYKSGARLLSPVRGSKKIYCLGAELQKTFSSEQNPFGMPTKLPKLFEFKKHLDHLMFIKIQLMLQSPRLLSGPN